MFSVKILSNKILNILNMYHGYVEYHKLKEGEVPTMERLDSLSYSEREVYERYIHGGIKKSIEVLGPKYVYGPNINKDIYLATKFREKFIWGKDYNIIEIKYESRSNQEVKDFLEENRGVSEIVDHIHPALRQLNDPQTAYSVNTEIKETAEARRVKNEKDGKCAMAYRTQLKNNAIEYQVAISSKSQLARIIALNPTDFEREQRRKVSSLLSNTGIDIQEAETQVLVEWQTDLVREYKEKKTVKLPLVPMKQK